MPKHNIPLSSPDIIQSDIDAVVDVMKTRHLSLGPKLPEFEKIVSDYVGTKHAIAVNSGTSGLHCLVKSLGWGPGDKIITSPFSFIASSNCILFEGAEVVFVDIDPVSYNFDPNLVEDACKKHKNDGLKGMVAVDIFGMPADWDKLNDITNTYNLDVIEDACEALGATYKGKNAGTFGDASLFAFYPNKQITTGEGGIVVTDRDDIAAMCRSLRNQGRGEGATWLQHARLGYNFRLSDMNCALGTNQVKRLPTFIEKRANVAKHYNECLADSRDALTPLQPLEGYSRSWFVYVVQLADNYTMKDRDRIIEALREKGIGSSNYFTPIHLQPFYQEMGFKKGDFPITERASARTIALPFFNNLTKEQVTTVTTELKALL